MKLQQIAIWHAEGVTEKDMKADLKTKGIDTRRLSRQTLLALSGALLLDKDMLANNTAQFLGTSFSSLSVFRKMHANVAQQVAMPLDLLAHLHNAPVFHTAAVLDLTGCSSVCAVWHGTNEWQPPLNAACRLFANQMTDSVLVGWVFEGEQVGDKPFEGAVWLHITIDRNTHTHDFRLPEISDEAWQIINNQPHFMAAASVFAQKWATQANIVCKERI